MLSRKLTLKDCFEAVPIAMSALSLVNKIAFKPGLGYSSTDGRNYWSCASRICSMVRRLERQITTNKFEFTPCVRRDRKVKGKDRILYISSWEDRIVERWLNDSMNRLLRGWFARSSYAYRTAELGLDQCQSRVARHIKTHKHIVKRDVSKFFYSIDQSILLDQLREIVDEADPLFRMILQRVNFKYRYDGNSTPIPSELGVPFGSPFACTLANIYLTAMDHRMSKLPVKYHRYADDIVILARTAEDGETARLALAEELTNLKLSTKPSHEIDMEMVPGAKLNHLGLEFRADGTVRLPIEKFRKIVNLFKNAFEREKGRFRKAPLGERLEMAVAVSNEIVHNRIRSAAIVDYYLKHINDERQIRELDILVRRVAVSAITGRTFKQRDLKTISPEALRSAGMVSLLHRSRLLRHGHLRVDFLSLFNRIKVDRYESAVKRQRDRINSIKAARKLKKTNA